VPLRDAQGDGDGMVIDTPITGSYVVWALLGGLNRLRFGLIESTTCYQIELVNPGTNTGSLSVPADWAFEYARVQQPSGSCDPRYAGPVQMSYEASDVTGTISFQAISPNLPTIIDSVQATVAFTSPPFWVPPSKAFSATNIEVTPL